MSQPLNCPVQFLNDQTAKLSVLLLGFDPEAQTDLAEKPAKSSLLFNSIPLFVTAACRMTLKHVLFLHTKNVRFFELIYPDLTSSSAYPVLTFHLHQIPGCPIASVHRQSKKKRFVKNVPVEFKS